MWAPRQWGVGTLVCEGTWEPLPHFVGEKTEAQRETASPRSRDDLMVEAVCGLQGGGPSCELTVPEPPAPGSRVRSQMQFTQGRGWAPASAELAVACLLDR